MTTFAKSTQAGTASAAPGEKPRRRTLPAIFYIVLTQAAWHHRRGTITREVFEAQLRRLAQEELDPRDLELLVRELPWGCTRFIVREKMTGAIRDMIDCSHDGPGRSAQ